MERTGKKRVTPRRSRVEFGSMGRKLGDGEMIRPYVMGGTEVDRKGDENEPGRTRHIVLTSDRACVTGNLKRVSVSCTSYNSGARTGL